MKIVLEGIYRSLFALQFGDPFSQHHAQEGQDQISSLTRQLFNKAIHPTRQKNFFDPLHRQYKCISNSPPLSHSSLSSSPLHLPYVFLFFIPQCPAFDLTSPQNHNAPTPTHPKRAAPDISTIPIPNPNPVNPPTASPSATLQDLLAFCASGSATANLPAVQEFCKLITGIAGTAGGISGGTGLGGGLGGILPPLPPIPGLPAIPGLGGGSGSGILPGGTGPVVPA